MCLWGNRKETVLSYTGKRIERGGLSVKEEGGHSKDSGTRERAKEIWREKEESS